MKAVRLVGVGKLQMQEVPIPQIGERDLLIRVQAAGICHSDCHYRSGLSRVDPLPLTLGHEVAGYVAQIGSQVHNFKLNDRVCLHYNVCCGDCYYCASGNDQFCPEVKMLGHFRDGGYAEYIAIPARNAIPLPNEIPYEQGATLMCASATAFHSLRKSRLKAGETIAIFGIGGLGVSAIQLAKYFGALEIFAVDINPEKLQLAEHYGCIPINSKEVDPVQEIKKRKPGGVDVAIEFIGLSITQKQALKCLGPMGRAVMVGLSNKSIDVDVYQEILGNEVELIGSNDHLLSELPLVIELARKGILDLSKVVSRTVPLDAEKINEVLDSLESFGGEVRTVIRLE